jgi:hypothetical protein
MRLRTPLVFVTLCWTLVATTAPARADSAALELGLAVTLPIAIPIEILGTIGAIKAARGDDQGYRTTTG